MQLTKAGELLKSSQSNLLDWILKSRSTSETLVNIFQFVSVENNMKYPQDFLGYCGVLNIAMVTIVIPYIVVGFMGYWKYGDGTKSSITLNLPSNEL